MRLSLPQWRAVLQWFVRGASSAEIARETGLERKRVLRALMLVRRAILRTAAHIEPRRDRRAVAQDQVARRSASARSTGARGPRSFPMRRRINWDGGCASARAASPLALHAYAAVVYRGRLHRLGGRRLARAVRTDRSLLGDLQRQLRSTGGIRRERLGLYLAAFAWRYNHRKLSRDEQVKALLSCCAALH